MICVALAPIRQQPTTLEAQCDSLPSVDPSQTNVGTSDLPYPGLEIAAAIVREFAQLSYNASDWEKLIGVSSVSSRGCLLDAWSISCSADNREQAKMSAATALRNAYSQYTNSPAAWKRKAWTDEDVDNILRIAFAAVSLAMNEPVADEAVTDAEYRHLSDNPEPSGFVPWRAFRNRQPTSDQPGIYVVGFFTDSPEQHVDLLSEHVIYIGLAAGQSTADRLRQFERTALFGLGHSGGWSYRVHFAPEVFRNRYSLLKRFHNTYCSWLAIPDGSLETPRDVERRLLSEYAKKWGRWPRLNRQG